MKIFSYKTDKKWLPQEPTKQDEHGRDLPDRALSELQRNLSDCFRCNHLVVLCGLGTSLHVNVDPARMAKEGRMPLKGKNIAPTMWDLWDAVQDAVGKAQFEKAIGVSRFPKDQTGNIEALLSYCKVAHSFITDAEGQSAIVDFIKQAEKTIRKEVRFLSLEDDVSPHADFLRRLSRRSSRKVRTKIFTTNYDLCFEYAARQGRYVVVDGFSHTTPQVFDSLYFTYDVVRRDINPDSHEFIPNVFHLYKLHGSIDWTKNSKTHEIEKDPLTESPLLVYPRNTKYELAFEQPYLEMMAALQSALRQPDTGLLILGFGFNDNHIAEPILAAIRANLGIKVVICDPGMSRWVDSNSTEQHGIDETNDHLKRIRYLIEQGDARLALVSETFEGLLPNIPDIAAQTDLEQHMERVRLLRGLDK